MSRSRFHLHLQQAIMALCLGILTSTGFAQTGPVSADSSQSPQSSQPIADSAGLVSASAPDTEAMPKAAPAAEVRPEQPRWRNAVHIHPVTLLFNVLPTSKGFQLEYERYLGSGYSFLVGGAYVLTDVENDENDTRFEQEGFGGGFALRKSLSNPIKGPYLMVKVGGMHLDIKASHTTNLGQFRSFADQGVGYFVVGYFGWEWNWNRVSLAIDGGVGPAIPAIGEPEKLGEKNLDTQLKLYSYPVAFDVNVALKFWF